MSKMIKVTFAVLNLLMIIMSAAIIITIAGICKQVGMPEGFTIQYVSTVLEILFAEYTALTLRWLAVIIAWLGCEARLKRR